MSLSLPEDAEPFLNDDNPSWDAPGVYALVLNKPKNLEEVWDNTFEERPAYWDELTEAQEVVYVGAAKSIMSRLEDHRNAKVRKAALMRVCEIDHLRNIWWMSSAEQAFIKESQIAMQLQNQYNDTYVHQR